MNGTPVKNLEGLVAAVEGCKEHFLHFQLEYNQVIVGKAPSPSTCLSLIPAIEAARPCQRVSHNGMHLSARRDVGDNALMRLCDKACMALSAGGRDGDKGCKRSHKGHPDNALHPS